ncbi:hypothetical protein AB4615_14065 [Vibrio splendidus]
MSIKTSISLFFLMMGFSFSAFSATLYQVSSGGSLGECGAVSKGDVVSSSYCSGTKTSYCSSVEKTQIVSGYLTPMQGYNSCVQSWVRAFVVSQCPDGTVVNPDTGVCEEPLPPPICEPPSQLDPDTNECITLPFCERDSTNEAIFAAEQSCAAEGGIFSFECSDFLESLETRCTQSDQCAIGFPNWPACLDDLDPSDDIAPPSGGFDPSNPPTANPDGPSFDKPEPDEVLPTDTTDEAVLKAVQNANRDSNEGFKALSTDLNNGFTDTNNALAKLNSTNTAIGESVVEQMNQDFKIHQANKDLALQQTGAITAGASSVTDALGSQTGALTGALGEQTDALTDAIGELSSKLPEKCVPNAENRYCENYHGLEPNYIGETFGQMDDQVDGIISGGHGLIESSLQSYIDAPMTDEIESIMTDSTNVLLDVLGYNDSCSALTFEANGKSYAIDCEVSQQIKLILSFLIGIYTLMTLIDILLDGIVPLGSKASATRYA